MSAHTAHLAGLSDELEDVGAHRLAGGPHEVAVRRLNCGLPATVVVELVADVEEGAVTAAAAGLWGGGGAGRAPPIPASSARRYSPR